MNNIVKVKEYFRSMIILFQIFRLVCIKTINTFAETLTDDEKSNPDKIDKAFKKFCSKVKVDSKEHRLVNIYESFI